MLSRPDQDAMFSKQLAALILFNHENRILLQHRSEDAPAFPGYWSLFGGGVERGETPEQAVRREVLEELGYRTTEPRLWRVQQYTHHVVNYERYIFVEEYDGSELILGEGQAMGWFLPSETNALRMTDPTRRIVEAVAGFLASSETSPSR